MPASGASLTGSRTRLPMEDETQTRKNNMNETPIVG